jgi:hypothetical protein
LCAPALPGCCRSRIWILTPTPTFNIVQFSPRSVHP